MGMTPQERWNQAVKDGIITEKMAKELNRLLKKFYDETVPGLGQVIIYDNMLQACGRFSEPKIDHVDSGQEEYNTVLLLFTTMDYDRKGIWTHEFRFTDREAKAMGLCIAVALGNMKGVTGGDEVLIPKEGSHYDWIRRQRDDGR